MGQPDRVIGSKKTGGEVKIILGNGYRKNLYDVRLSEIGSEDSKEGDFTARGWVMHLRHKRWWSPSLESEFIKEVKKYL